MGIDFLSVRELRQMKIAALETYKARLCLAVLDASTELERETVRNQVLRVNSILNECHPLEVTR